jgi:hypothetical protein
VSHTAFDRWVVHERITIALGFSENEHSAPKTYTNKGEMPFILSLILFSSQQKTEGACYRALAAGNS